MEQTAFYPQMGDNEGQKLEFKRTYNLQDPEILTEMAKDVAAMASTEGGFIWIGIDDQNDSVTGYAPMMRIPAKAITCSGVKPAADSGRSRSHVPLMLATNGGNGRWASVSVNRPCLSCAA